MGSSVTTAAQEVPDIMAGRRNRTTEEFTNATSAVQFFTELKGRAHEKGIHLRAPIDVAQ